MRGIFLLLLAVVCLAQKAGVDGITKRTETHRIVMISDGEFRVYGFKKYGIRWKLECEVQKP